QKQGQGQEEAYYPGQPQGLPPEGQGPGQPPPPQYQSQQQWGGGEYTPPPPPAQEQHPPSHGQLGHSPQPYHPTPQHQHQHQAPPQQQQYPPQHNHYQYPPGQQQQQQQPAVPDAAGFGSVTPQVKLSQYEDTGKEQAGSALSAEQAVVDEEAIQLRNMNKELVFEGLKKLYRKKILPLEESSKYSHFHSPPLNPADFEAKPMVLIVGQYSVGKTSFIRSLLGCDFPGQRVGPEPTTDRFVAVSHGEEERVMPGHALAMQAEMPFRSLQQFGNAFLTKFEGSVVNSDILRNITLVDTPGVLSGEKQRIGRDYDFSSVISWFAERADLIIIMFDAHKLDISDELKMVIDTLRPHHDKMRVLLNKADTIDTQQLMRVYGALMWSLGKVMQTPEVCRVYIGSFWDNPIQNHENRQLLAKEKQDLLDELMRLPDNAVIRRINELVKRARSVKVHAYIIHYLRKQMPYVMGKQEKQAKLIGRLDHEFLACARRYGLPLGDFPKVEKFRRSLREVKDISKVRKRRPTGCGGEAQTITSPFSLQFQKLDKGLVVEMDKVFSQDIPRLMERAQA
ncbi:unnamed protein product, partial [Chrysoparadoxa australica]